MSDVVVRVENLTKRYRLGQHTPGATMLREVFADGLAKLTGRKRAEQPEHVWAVQDVSFEIKRGEVLGIIGRNGAGKSTLLKLLSRITYPTSGKIRVDGRLASLLEVGTGFHEELTGYENIYLNGSILGMTQREIDEHIEQIVDFAGIGPFIDTPIKRYSSGMRLRLGFAVAAHLSPEILVVDEVLAVGDAEFQRKCLNAMDELRSAGRTVLFVSHNMAAIENLCSRCIWIEAGRIKADGPPVEVIADYMKTFSRASSGTVDLERIPSRSGNGQAVFTSMSFLDRAGEITNYLRSGDAIIIRLHYRARERLRDFVIGINVHTELGTLVAASNNWATGDDIPIVEEGEGYADFEIDCLYLLPGRYYLSLWLGKWENLHDVLKDCISFDVESSDYYGSGRGIESRFGLMFFPSRWRSEPPQVRLAAGAGIEREGTP
jgi:lipopolysaccharide transport system ATP-binding protein